MFSAISKLSLVQKSISMSAVSISSLSRSFSAVALNTISDNAGANKQRKRVGRGNASGHGTTAGRGKHGQNARSGPFLHRYGPYVGFIGGQTPMYRRVPKVGFTNPNSKPLDPLRLDKLQKWIDDGRIDPNHVITMKNLVDSGLMSNIKYGVKIVGHGHGDFHSKIRIDVTRASEAAIKIIEGCGGQVICSHYNRLALRLLLKPQKFVPPYPLRARPPPRLMEYYTSDEHRGYLSPSYSLVYQEFLKDMHATGNVVSPNGNGRIE